MKNEKILKEVLEKIEPGKEDEKILADSLKAFLIILKKKIEKLKNKPEIFVGGSYAKKTLIKKDEYDIDIFLRFSKYKDDEISSVTEKLIKGIKNISKVHGSRDYFRIKINDNLIIELVPVLKTGLKENAKNITDLSYSHVKYINGKIKNSKILDEIKIAKAFCHANNCYGAESYINGFSGYALELLVYYYKSFNKMLRELSKKTEGKIIIDIEKHYKKKSDVLIDMNSSKLESPIILVDPTFRQRNALAALSYETYEKFRKVAKEFLKNPSQNFFEKKKIDLEKIKKDALKKKREFILIEVSTDRQEGDIAGSKLFKFYNHMTEEISRFFDVKNKGFNYNRKKSARYFFVVSKKKEIIYDGPFDKDEKNVKSFMKEHKNIFKKKNRIYAREKVSFGIKEFLKKWEIKNKRKVKEMSIDSISVI